MIDHTNEFHIMLVVLATVIANSLMLGILWRWFWL